MKGKLWIAIAIGVVLVALSRFAMMNSHPWPSTIYQPFSSWGEAWVLPPRPSGRYTILLAYFKRDGGRLDRTLKAKVIDETAGEPVPQFRDWEYAEVGPYDDWQVEEIAYFRTVEGHRYRIEIDPDQLKELSRYRHKLGVDLTPDEKMNWNRRGAASEDQMQSPKKKKEWKPRELEKARAIKKAWEAEKARLYPQ